jgi:2'-5' RNA ligase
MAGPRTLRTFIAVPLSAEVERGLDDVQRQLRRAVPERCVRWVNPSGIHLTLHFLGDILPERVEPVKAALAAVSRNIPPFQFYAGELGAFPNLNRPRVVWVGVQDPSSWLALLHEAVSEAMGRLGFQPERRRFSPHLTLGRVRRNTDRRDAATLGEVIARTKIGTLGIVPVRDVVFFKSVLKPTGAEYTPLGTFRLEAAPSSQP